MFFTNMAKKENVQIEALKLQQKQMELQMQNNQILRQAIEKGLPILEKYFNKRLELVESPKIRWSILGFVGILFVVVIGSGFLVYAGKLESGNFTFLLGTLLGATITFLGDIVLAPQ